MVVLRVCPDSKVNQLSSLPPHFLSATPKSSPGSDYLCWDDTLPDIWGHQCKAGADGGPHELGSCLGALGMVLSVHQAHGLTGRGFWLCFHHVSFVLSFVLCIFVNTNKFL